MWLCLWTSYGCGLLQLLTTVTVDDLAPGLKTIFNFKVPDQRSGKVSSCLFRGSTPIHWYIVTLFISIVVYQVELQYLNDHFGISTSLGLTASPVLTFAGVMGTSTLGLGADISFDTKTGDFAKMNAGLSFSNADLVCSLTLWVAHNFSLHVCRCGNQHVK